MDSAYFQAEANVGAVSTAVQLATFHAEVNIGQGTSPSSTAFIGTEANVILALAFIGWGIPID